MLSSSSAKRIDCCKRSINFILFNLILICFVSTIAPFDSGNFYFLDDHSMPKLKNHFPRTYSMVRLVFNKESYLYKSGCMESLKSGYPSDRKGNPLPWMNRAVVRILDERLNPGLRRVEYGRGSLTLAYASRTERVASGGDNAAWTRLVKERLPQNGEVLVNAKQGYAAAIHSTDQMHEVVIVEGIGRVSCMMKGLQRLNDPGVL